MESLRQKDRKDFFKSAAKDDIECLKRLIVNLSLEEKEEAYKIIDFIEERKAFNNIGDDNEEQVR